MSAPGVRVSMITPFLNAEAFLAEAIESVLAQTYGDWELLLVDDGSTDDSTEIARRYAEQHPDRIRYLAHPGRENRGASAARNLGIAHARGEYLALLDADDLCEPERLEKQVAYLDANPEIALLGAWYSIIDTRGACIAKMPLPSEWQELRWELFFSNPFATSAVMLRRKLMLRSVGLHDERYVYAQDYELWCRIADAFPVANLRDFLARRRVHPASLTWAYPDAAPEFGRLRLARIAPLLGWSTSEREGSAASLQSMTALYYGWAKTIEPAVLNQAVEDILGLHRSFSRGKETGVIERRRRALHATLASNLVMLAVFCSSDDLGVRARLLARAWRLEPRVFLRPRTLVRAARALAGAYVPRFRAAPAVGA